MPASSPTILATSMGFAGRGRGPYDWRPGPVFDLAVELAGNPTRPRLCYLGTATGDDPARVGAVYGAFADTDVRVSHLSLFPMPSVADARAHPWPRTSSGSAEAAWPTCSPSGGCTASTR